MASPTPAGANLKLAHFPVTMFAFAMGILAFSTVLQLAAQGFDWAHAIFPAVRAMAIILFVLVLVIYLFKVLIFRVAVVGEFKHPIRVAYFPTIPISLVIMAGLLIDDQERLAQILWAIGAGLQGGLILGVFSRWIGNKPYQHAHINAAWFMPVVGCLIIPVVGVPLGYLELSWLFFSTGIIFWMILLSLVMNRLVFHGPAADKILPTLIIMVAPPAVAFVAFIQLAPDSEVMARLLLNMAYAFGFVVVMQLPRVVKMPFDLSLWMLVFPLAALTVASFNFGGIAESATHGMIGIVLFGLLALIAAGLFVRTIIAILRGEIFRPE